MRRFVIIGHRAPTTPDFTLNDLAGSSGRLDVLLRCVTQSFYLSNNFRRDVEMFLVLLGGDDPPRTLRFSGSELRYLNPDERSTGALVRNALIQCRGKDEDTPATPGITALRWDLDTTLRSMPGGSLVWLHEEGSPINCGNMPPEPTFILSDDREFSDEDIKVIRSFEPLKISLGKTSYLSSQCITLAHWMMDQEWNVD